jgi:hypothetical protein
MVICFISTWFVLFIVVEFFWMVVHFSDDIAALWSWDFVVTQLANYYPVIVVLLIKQLVFDRAAKYAMTRGGFVVRWCEFAWFLIVTLPFYTIISTLAAIYRLIFLVCLSLAFIVRVDFTIFPKSVQSMDAAYTASMSMLLSSHRHHNPVMYCFVRSFLDKDPDAPANPDDVATGNNDPDTPASPEDALKGAACGGHQVSKKARKDWRLAVTLAHNPQLVPYRCKPDRKFEGPSASGDESIMNENDAGDVKQVTIHDAPATVHECRAADVDQRDAWCDVPSDLLCTDSPRAKSPFNKAPGDRMYQSRSSYWKLRRAEKQAAQQNRDRPRDSDDCRSSAVSVSPAAAQTVGTPSP